MYKKSLKSPKTMMYINMEGKFLKYFKWLSGMNLYFYLRTKYEFYFAFLW
jgi:hypothetical protein